VAALIAAGGVGAPTAVVDVGPALACHVVSTIDKHGGLPPELILPSRELLSTPRGVQARGVLDTNDDDGKAGTMLEVKGPGFLRREKVRRGCMVCQ